jgi:hypothetical protein
MNKIVFVGLIQLFFISEVYCQIRFEPGYVIDHEGRKTECLIKNQDWKDNPEKITYKLSESDTVRTGTVATLSEFKVAGFARYLAVDIKIDRSSSAISELTVNRKPVWSQEKIFVKAIVEGKATLYMWSGDNLIRFFYSVDDKPVEQLVYKQYLVSPGRTGENNTYHGQLWNDVRCSDARSAEMKSLQYRQSKLEMYFKEYNKCNGSEPTEEPKMAVRNVFNLKVTAGLNMSSLDIVREFNVFKTEMKFDDKVTPRLGVEAEFIMPFHKNKWGLLIEPSFQSFKSKASADNFTASINYSFVEFAIGVRHYFFLNEKARAFLNIYYVPGLRFARDKDLQFISTKLDISQTDTFSGGLGLQYGRISGDFRYYVNADITAQYAHYLSSFGRTSFTVGYKLIKLDR